MIDGMRSWVWYCYKRQRVKIKALPELSRSSCLNALLNAHVGILTIVNKVLSCGNPSPQLYIVLLVTLTDFHAT